MSWTIYVFIFIPVTFNTFQIREICQIDAQNLRISAVCVIMAVVFTQHVGICIICRHIKFLLPVSSGLLAVAVLLKSQQGLHMDTHF
jgi:hypothetical protein